MAYIFIEKGADRGKAIPVPDREVLLFGRSPHCQVCFEDNLASRVHFVVEHQREGRLLIDQQSRNGTFLNGEKVACAKLNHGDQIDAGDTTFTYSEDEEVRTDTGPVGREIGGFRIEKRIGRGGMSTVYRGVQVALDRTVAVKVLSPTRTERPESVVAFYGEAKASVKLIHPRIVEVFGFGEEEGLHYIAQEFMRFGSLQDHLGRLNKLPLKDALPVMIDVCDALEFIEQEGIVHRDIKPDNVLLTDHGRAKLGDLGAAMHMDSPDETLRLVGTPHFMSPEQAELKPVDCRSDIYGLGCTIYRTVGGANPFTGATTEEIIEDQLTGDARSLGELNAEIPEKLLSLVSRMMSRSPEGRPANATEVRGELEACLREEAGAKPSRAIEEFEAPKTGEISIKEINEPAPFPPGLRVLVVDDQRVSVLAAERACKVLGCITESASSGPEALDLLDSEQFDFLLTDRIMPEMSGDVLAINVRARFPDMPVVMLTSLGAEMLEAGEQPECVDLVLSKPVTKQRLSSAFRLVRAGLIES
ncbi:MAG: protein kinase [Planctomycetota bacterium]|jgi:serine/threonine protein kinase|nr:protein kinase [Planctomycetota bacterium]